MVAQTTHAAGISARLADELPEHTHAIVKAARDEAHLLEIEARLHAAGVRFITFREPDPPFNGAATAIGICPGPRQPVRKLLSDLPLLR